MRLSSAGIRLPFALALAVFSGALLSLSLPPANAGWIAFLAPIPLIWLLRDARPSRGLLMGFAFGLAYFGALLYWLLLFGGLAWGSITVVSAAFLGVFGLLAPSMWRGERPIRSAFGLAALWTVLEWLRGMFPVGGFTWGSLGSTQADNRFLLPLASVGGMWSLSFIVLAASILLLLAFERARRRLLWASGHLALAAGLVLAPVLIHLPAPNGRTLDIAALQVDVRRAKGLAPLAEDQAVATMNIALDARLAADPPDLAVWGESSLDPGANLPAFRPLVTAAIANVGAPTLAGAVVSTPGGATYNESLLFDGGGEVIGEYRKVHLVPFGEYVPFRDALSWISALQQIPYDETPGDRLHTLRFDGLTFANVICFENSFPSIDRTLVAQGATFIVVTTNNASYDLTAASRQQLIMSRLRAVEDGRWVVHAAVSGISAFIDPTGRIVAQTSLFDTTILRRTIRTSSTETLYVRLGDWVPSASLLFVLAIFALPRRRRPRASVPEPLAASARTLVILPTYGEHETIERVMEGLLALPERVDVLVIDDSSPDGTGDLVRATAEREERVRLITRPSKSGLASAYLLGFRTAIDEGYDLIAEMDSDLSHEPEELPRLLAAARANDLAIGSRYVPGGSVTNWSAPRVALSKAGNLYARVALGFPLRDSTSGFRVFRRCSLLRLVRDPIRSEGYGFQIELALRAWNAGYSVVEVPISFREREHGHSKISRRIIVEALWLVTVWGVKARLRDGRRPQTERP